VVVDGAHNPGACEVSAATLREFEFDDLHVAFGAMHDKDHRGMAAAFDDAASVTTCRPDVDRAEDPEVLATVFRAAGVGTVETAESVVAAVERARERAGPDDCVLAVGSLSVVAEARAPSVRLVRPLEFATVDDAREALGRAHVDRHGVDRTAGSAVHRVVHTRLQRRQARRLQRELLSIGGDCAVSAISGGEELVDVVATGTRSQFDRLVETLDGAPHGLPGVADELRRTLAGRQGRPEHGYPWEQRPSVMGVLNVTPDSFHDGGEYVDLEDAIDRAEAMVEAGADVVDVGGESTRPGADPVAVDDEIDRVVPVIDAIADLDVTISVDTRKAEVGRAALDAGADVLNDVTGLDDPEMRFLAAEREVPVVVMHSIDAPVVAGKDVAYDDVVRDVLYELRETLFVAEKAGIARENVIVDPGLGFGKSPAESFELLGRLGEFRALGCPILVGHSHKSMFGLVGQDAGERLPSTIAGTAVAVRNGADIVRVHDVAENVAAVRTAVASVDPARFVDE
jgi:dihydropteroate synthase